MAGAFVYLPSLAACMPWGAIGRHSPGGWNITCPPVADSSPQPTNITGASMSAHTVPALRAATDPLPTTDLLSPEKVNNGEAASTTPHSARMSWLWDRVRGSLKLEASGMQPLDGGPSSAVQGESGTHPLVPYPACTPAEIQFAENAYWHRFLHGDALLDCLEDLASQELRQSVSVWSPSATQDELLQAEGTDSPAGNQPAGNVSAPLLPPVSLDVVLQQALWQHVADDVLTLHASAPAS
jgi:hypothetical protein